MNECIHGIEHCALCAHGPENLAPHVERTFRARFESQCPECDLPIMVAQVIHRIEPTGIYVHDGCQP